MSVSTTRDALIDALTALEGQHITKTDAEDVGRKVSEYHGAYIEANPDDEEGFFELVDRTDPIENALDAYAARDETPSSEAVETMCDLLRGDVEPEEATEFLPQPTIDELSSPLDDNPELQDALAKSMAGRIPEFQEDRGDTVYCEKCDGEYDFTPSVLSVHNMRRHEYHPDIYDYDDPPRTCSECGAETTFTGAESVTGVELKACTECGEFQ